MKFVRNNREENNIIILEESTEWKWRLFLYNRLYTFFYVYKVTIINKKLFFNLIIKCVILIDNCMGVDGRMYYCAVMKVLEEEGKEQGESSKK